MSLLRVLVVDASTLHRRALTEALESLGGLEVVDAVANGAIALRRLADLDPELVVVDAANPDMDSLQLARQLRVALPQAGLLVTVEGAADAAMAVPLLQAGALECIAKPRLSGPGAQIDVLQAELARAVSAHRARQSLLGVTPADGPTPPPSAPSLRRARPTGAPAAPPPRPAARPAAPVEVVAVGISTGGPKALAELVPRLPASLPVPIVLVQHMPASFTGTLTESLASRGELPVVEGAHGQTLAAGTLYIAPGGRQMKVVGDWTHPRLALTDDPPENHCRPAADYLFRSVAAIFGPRALGVVMTGMGADGREGLRLMKARGAHTVAQDEATSMVFGMPMEAIKAGVVDEIVPLDRMADAIVRLVAHGR